MRGLRRTIATAAVTLILAGLVVFGTFGAFKTGDDLDRDAERLDASVAEAEAVAPEAVRLDHGKKCSVKNIKGPEPEPADPEQPSSPG